MNLATKIFRTHRLVLLAALAWTTNNCTSLMRPAPDITAHYIRPY